MSRGDTGRATAMLNAVGLPGGPLRLGIIGGGEAATKALTALDGVSWINVIWVACRADELKGLVPSSARVEDWVAAAGDLSTDVVYVATPVATHVPIAAEILRHGRCVLIEKPLALSTCDATPLMVWADSPLVAAVALKKRFGDAIAYVHRLCAERGAPRRARFVWHLGIGPGGWRCDRHISGGGVVMDLGCHILDLVEHLFGPIRAVRADMRSFVGGCEGEATIQLRLANGLEPDISLAWGPDSPCQEMSLDFEHTRITYVRGSGTQDLVVDHGRHSIQRTTFDARSDYVRMFSEVGLRIQTGTGKIVDLAAGVRNLALIESVYSAATRHQLVSLGPEPQAS